MESSEIDLAEQVYLLFGLGGAIGNAFYSTISEITTEYRLFAFDHARVDVTNKDHVAPILEYFKPTVIFNCTAISDPDICEKAHNGAYRVNSDAPMLLAKEAKKCGAKLIHISSQYVFDGSKDEPYTEKCKPHPKVMIGKSKLEGEQGLACETDNYIVARPGWMFGPHENGHLMTWIRQADARLKIDIREDEKISPIYVGDFVDSVLHLMRLNCKGTYNIVNDGTPTMEEFADKVLELIKKEGNIYKMKDLYETILPKNILLSSKKYKTSTKKDMRNWESALKACLYSIDRYDLK